MEQTPQQTEPKDRLTIVENIYYQPKNDEATSIVSSFDRILESSEQLYKRNLKLSTDWQTIDTGWLKKISCLILVNLSEEKLEFRFMDSDNTLIIFPRENLRCCPSNIEEIQVRSHGSSDAILYLLPN
jgi:hypothetical protein